MSEYLKKPSRNERVWATICQLLGLFFGAAFFITLIIWLCKRKSSEFINKSGKEALNFQLSALVYFIIGYAIIWIIFIELSQIITWGFYHRFLFGYRGAARWIYVAIMVWIGFVIYQPIRAAVKVSRGLLCRYQAIIRFIK